MSISNSPQQDNRKVQPTSWALEQKWRKVFPWDSGDATESRRAMVDLNFYPLDEISKNSAFDFEEANYRYALHQVVDELSREDLRAVFSLCRLLVLFPDGVKPAIELAQVKSKSKRFLEWYGKQKKEQCATKKASEVCEEPTEEPDYLQLINETEGEPIEEPDWLEMLDDPNTES